MEANAEGNSLDLPHGLRAEEEESRWGWSGGGWGDGVGEGKGDALSSRQSILP